MSVNLATHTEEGYVLKMVGEAVFCSIFILNISCGCFPSIFFVANLYGFNMVSCFTQVLLFGIFSGGNRGVKYLDNGKKVNIEISLKTFDAQ